MLLCLEQAVFRGSEDCRVDRTGGSGLIGYRAGRWRVYSQNLRARTLHHSFPSDTVESRRGSKCLAGDANGTTGFFGVAAISAHLLVWIKCKGCKGAPEASATAACISCL